MSRSELIHSHGSDNVDREIDSNESLYDIIYISQEKMIS